MPKRYPYPLVSDVVITYSLGESRSVNVNRIECSPYFSNLRRTALSSVADFAPKPRDLTFTSTTSRLFFCQLKLIKVDELRRISAFTFESSNESSRFGRLEPN